MLKIISKILVLIAVIGITACSGLTQVTSLKNNNQIKIDGDHSDWQQLTNIKGENISFGFNNDSDNLYLTVVTNDRNKIMKILRGGLEVWIEPENSSDKIGIRYPEKPDPAEMMEQFRSMQKDMMNQKNPPEINEDKESDAGMKMFLAKQKEIYILDEDGNTIKTFPVNGDTYKASIKADKTGLCYELKIPFGKKPFLNADLNNVKQRKISVDIVTGSLEPDFEKMKGSDDLGGFDGNRPSGPPPMGGNPPGGMGGNPPGDMSRKKQNFTPLEYSFELQLSN